MRKERWRVLLHRVCGIVVPLHGRNSAEPIHLGAEVESAGAGEQRDRRALGHLAILAVRPTSNEHPTGEVEREHGAVGLLCRSP